jgi:uncharacterized membrane protein
MVMAAVAVPQRRRHKLARHVDEHRIRAAIDAAEARTTGKLHVTLSHDFRGATIDHAMSLFRRLRLDRTPERNGVLFFVVPARREFAIVGDAGIHTKVGQEFWDRVVGAMSAAIAASDLTAGLIHGIEEAGKELATHFPRPSAPPER